MKFPEIIIKYRIYCNFQAVQKWALQNIMGFTHLSSYLMNIFHWFCILFPKNDGVLYVQGIFTHTLFSTSSQKEISVLHKMQFSYCFNYPCTFTVFIFRYELNILSCRLKIHFLGCSYCEKYSFTSIRNFLCLILGIAWDQNQLYCVSRGPVYNGDQKRSPQPFVRKGFHEPNTVLCI